MKIELFFIVCAFVYAKLLLIDVRLLESTKSKTVLAVAQK